MTKTSTPAVSFLLLLPPMASAQDFDDVEIRTVPAAHERSRERMQEEQVLGSGTRQQAYSEEGLPKITPGHGQVSTIDDLREFGAMLTTIRDRMRPLVDRGRSVDEVIESDPARGFVSRSEATDRWVRLAYESMR